jgi:hypothetical protein
MKSLEDAIMTARAKIAIHPQRQVTSRPVSPSYEHEYALEDRIQKDLDQSCIFWQLLAGCGTTQLPQPIKLSLLLLAHGQNHLEDNICA